jgi:aminoglycoside N3'-acetyltransferase
MRNPLDGHWDDSGINKGDCVLIHSSMKRTFSNLTKLGVETNPRLVIDSLLGAVGRTGTILLPLFNFDFPVTKVFSINSTPSQMGLVTEFARQQYGGVRTGHPIYSFFALGANQSEFIGINNKSGYGLDSPFAKLLEMDGKIAVVDLDDQGSMTSYHFVEEKCEVTYRYYKTFPGTYEDANGNETIQKYELYVRDLEAGVTTSVNRMGEILWEEGLYKGNRPNIGNGMRTIKMKIFCERTQAEIMAGRAIDTLYEIMNP